MTPSKRPHERAGLDFVKKRLADREPYRAWSNYTFTDSRGGLNEVDLLVVTPPAWSSSRPYPFSGDPATPHQGPR